MKPLIIHSDGLIRCLKGFPNWLEARNIACLVGELTYYPIEHLAEGLSWIEFKITRDSIWDVLELGWNQRKILSFLSKYSPEIPAEMREFIRKTVRVYGQVKIVPFKGEFLAIEPTDNFLSLQELIKHLDMVNLAGLIRVEKKRLIFQKNSKSKIKRLLRKLNYPARDLSGGSKIGYTRWTINKAINLIWRAKVVYGRAYQEILRKFNKSFPDILKRLFPSTLQNKSWEIAISLAGLEPQEEKGKINWSSNKLLEMLKTIKKREGRIDPPYLRKYHQKFFASLTSGIHFSGKGKNGKWNRAVRLIGLEPKKEYQAKEREKWSRPKIRKQLQEIKRKGEAINRKNLQDNHPKLDEAISNSHHYQGRNQRERWEVALKDAGFDPQKEQVRSFECWNRQKIAKRIRQRQQKGLPIYPAALLSNDPHCYYAIEGGKYFSGKDMPERWAKALIYSKIDPEKETYHAYTQRWIVRRLKEIKKECSKLNIWHLSKHHGDVWGKLLRFFPGENQRECWENGLKFAGFNPRKERRKKWKLTK